MDISKSPPVKPYKLELKVDAERKKGQKKKIYYPNTYDFDVTYKVRNHTEMELFAILVQNTLNTAEF